MQLRIDTNSKIPLHYQIRCGILSVLRGRNVKPGDFLFTEVELSRQTGVSLGTVRQAVDPLAFQGVLERRRAKGVFLRKFEDDN